VLLGAEPVQKAFCRNSWLITSCLERRSRYALESDAGRYRLLIPEEETGQLKVRRELTMNFNILLNSPLM